MALNNELRNNIVSPGPIPKIVILTKDGERVVVYKRDCAGMEVVEDWIDGMFYFLYW